MGKKHQVKAGSNPTGNKKRASAASARKKRGISWGFAHRTVFDWAMLVSQVLGAIAIPFVVTFVGLYFTQQLTQQQALESEKQHDTDLQIAVDQQRETTLNTCLDNIKDLLLNKGLRTSKPKDEVRVMARVNVLAALRQLDGKRKGLLMQFLSEAELITQRKNDVIIDLNSADLTGTDLSHTSLHEADLAGANLNNASMPEADLSEANLNNTNLGGADLTGANPRYANLRYADLSNAYMPEANLSNADLSHADLRVAYLRGAEVTQAQLAEAMLLTGAIMPDGSRHP